MSKFIQNKRHLQTALIICFNLKKIAAKSYPLLREAYSQHDPTQDTCERLFRSRQGTLKTVKNSKVWNCKMIRKHKNNSPNTWTLVIKLFSITMINGNDSQDQYMGTTWVKRALIAYEDVKKWLDEWFAAKGEGFYRNLKKKCITSDGTILIKCIFLEKIHISYLYTW